MNFLGKIKFSNGSVGADARKKAHEASVADIAPGGGFDCIGPPSPNKSGGEIAPNGLVAPSPPKTGLGQDLKAAEARLKLAACAKLLEQLTEFVDSLDTEAFVMVADSYVLVTRARRHLIDKVIEEQSMRDQSEDTWL